MRERPNRHAWKACVAQVTVGSNPTPSATVCVTKTRHCDAVSVAQAGLVRGRRVGVVDDVDAMEIALAEARAALDHDDVPVGAVVLHGDAVIARRHNERELTGDPTAHAEVLALRDAAAHLGTWRLDECTLVVTLEPCVMCAGAALNARIGRVVFGAADPKAGAMGSLYQVAADPRLNHNPPVQHGVLSAEAAAILAAFFAARR